MYIHPHLNKFIKTESILSYNHPKYEYNIIEKFGLREIKDYKNTQYRGNIDWDLICPSFVYSFLNDGNEQLISILSKSEMSKKDKIVVEVGYGGVVLILKTKDFFKYWEEILLTSRQGFPVISEDGKLIMEFLENDQLIYSNFLIG
ncbi:hypothetical protein [Fulvivirga sediminis]|uniref:Uncharacterized protein n=1 Tax=Fulvivirga sediminis TaxID=2803949 RepID=A0A937F9B7_9BACT|nr:hypothetical protein [Fulvivirga sediminis]MBL3656655.1 hypothetical protein [Fulvivirga sediminis]